MNELPLQTDAELSLPTAQIPAKKGRKPREEKVAEFVSAKIKLRLIRDCHIDGNIVLAGNIVEVDEVVANDLLKTFPVPAPFFGYRPGVANEKTVRAEKV